MSLVQRAWLTRSHVWYQGLARIFRCFDSPQWAQQDRTPLAGLLWEAAAGTWAPHHGASTMCLGFFFLFACWGASASHKARSLGGALCASVYVLWVCLASYSTDNLRCSYHNYGTTCFRKQRTEAETLSHSNTEGQLKNTAIDPSSRVSK